MKILMPERRARKRILLLILILSILVFLFSNRNFRTLINLQKEKRRLQRYLEVAREENAELKKRLEMYKNDPGYLEDLAREKLGMIKPGEVKYKFIDAEEFGAKEKKR